MPPGRDDRDLQRQGRYLDASRIVIHTLNGKTYGFGYALGTSFKNRKGRREMLWPEDLREILERGETRRGCRIAP